MTIWSYDMAAAPEEDEVILAFQVGGDQSRILARRAWFDTEVAGERVLAWTSTYTGERLPAEWSVYAWMVAPIPPDPGGF